MASQLVKSHLFEAAYKATADGVKAKGFARSDSWSMLMPRLTTMCGAASEMTHAEALETLRKHASERAIKAGSHGKFLLTASSVEGDHGTPNAEQIARIAALELLCHTYFHSTKGQEAVWVVSIPSNYTTWPHLQLAGKTVADILASLDGSGTEKFSVTNRRNIASAAQTALAWTLKALVMLDTPRWHSTARAS